ncbi:MAG: site-specific integrase [Clostridiales Family XIII bacterium]|nr:site-specific integrase [Clostridiales Family XIII bacterium]
MKFFASHLKHLGMSDHTLESYLFTVRKYLAEYDEITKKNLAAYRSDLIDRYAPKTVNIRIAAMNTYMKYLKKETFLMKNVKVQQKPFLENVICEADYAFLKKSLKKDGNTRMYFMVWFLAATGARVAEFVKLKAEHVRAGHVDLYGKGGKMRRIYIPKKLRTEALLWLDGLGRDTGYLFVDERRRGSEKNAHLSTRGVTQALQSAGRKYGIEKAVMHPHSFRHLFGKMFFERTKDLALLADLMGHESIDTTRIYTRRTATEQRALVDEVVTW